MPVNNLIQLRRGSDWSANPVLSSGEPGFDIPNNQLKIGDGSTAWSGLTPVNYNLNNYSITGVGNIDISGNLTANTGLLDQLVFNTGLDDPNLTAGQLQWNSTEGTLDLGLNDSYAMHLGEEMLYRVRNVTGSTLLAGQPVYASGLSPGANNRIEVNLYAADGSIREIRFMGLMTEDLTDNGNNGYATHFGYIRGIDTRGDATTYGTINKLWTTGEPAWNQGDVLYVHPTVPGKLTKIEPKHSISVAIITNVAQNGKIFVRPTSYGHLDDNHDVSVSGVTNGQFLQYNSATDYWVPSSSGNFSTLQVNGTSVPTGIGLSDYITKWIGTNGLGTGIVYDNGTNVGIGTSVPSYKLDVVGTGHFDALNINGAFTFPTIDGSANQYLKTDGAGNVSWASVDGGGGGVTINNYADNRVLTSDGSSTGINAESKLVFIPDPSGNKLGIGTTNPNGNLSISNGSFGVDGDSQHTFLTARTATTNSSTTTLFLDGSSTKIVLPPKCVWNFCIKLNCYSDTNDGAASWNFRGCIKRTGSATSMVGSIIEENFIDSNLDGVIATIVANTDTNSLDINVNGLDSNNIRWTASLDITQTRYDTNNYVYFLPMMYDMVP